MKLILLAVLFPLFCLAQNEKAVLSAPVVYQDSVPNTALFLKDKRIIYQKIFTANLTKDELYNKVNTLLSTINGYRFDHNVYPADGEIYGRLFQHQINYLKYDVGIFSGAALVYPIDANVVVQVKDNKYRVTVTEITFRTIDRDPTQRVNLMLDDLITQKSRTRITRSKNYLKLANYMNEGFNDIFNLNRSVITGDF